MKAVLFISHGSRSAKSGEENKATAAWIREQSGLSVVEYAFLEVCEPSIPEGIDKCIARGATEIVVLLNFLNSGRHVVKDIPEILQTAREKYPQVRIMVTPPIGFHPEVRNLFLELIEKSR